MSNPWYQVSGTPGFHSFGSSAAIRAEFELLGVSFALLPALTGNGTHFWRTNAAGTAVESLSAADTRTALGLVIGTNVQAYSAVLALTTAAFTTAMETKLNYITVNSAVDFDSVMGTLNNLSYSVSLAITAANTATAQAAASSSSASSATASASAATTQAGIAVSAASAAAASEAEVEALVATIDDITTADPTIAVVLSGGKYTVNAALGRRFEVDVTATANLEISNFTIAAAISTTIAIVTRNHGAYTIPVVSSTDGHSLKVISGTVLALTAAGVDRYICTLHGTSNNEIFIEQQNHWVAL